MGRPDSPRRSAVATTDNVTFQTTVATPPDATIVATDDVGGVHFQKVKLVDGTDGATTAAKVSSTGALQATGDVAHDSADAGNPVKIGGKAKNWSTATPVADGDRVEANFTSDGFLATAGAFEASVGDSTPNNTLHQIVGIAAATSLTSAGPLIVSPLVYNGTSWDRQRGTSADGTLVNLGSNNDVTVASLPLPAGAATAALQTQPGVDIGDVTINNAAGASAVNIQDGGNAITVDGTVTVGTLPALVAGSANIGDVDIASIAAGDNNIGNVDVVSLPALVAGSANIGDVDVLTLPGVGGLAAHASPASGNPVYVAGRASSAVPTDVGADGDAAALWTNRSGAVMVVAPLHVGLNADPWNLVHEGAQYTGTQTSTVLIAGGAGDKIVVTQVQIQVAGTVAGDVQLYFGTGAFSRGTSRAIFDGTFKPSATLAPGVILEGPFISGTNGDDLLVTTSAAINPLTFSVWYYIVT